MLALTSLLATSAIPEHEIKSLPGWSGPLPSRQYSGYLPVGKTSGVPGFIHYWLILSERDPASDPLVYWTNGGPGGSGINAGLLTEMGQWHLNEDSLTNNTQDMPKLLYNEYNWAKVASTLYVSQPTRTAMRAYPSPSASTPTSRPRRTPWTFSTPSLPRTPSSSRLTFI